MLSRHRAELARVTEPVARALVGLRLRPNQLSCLGLVASAAAAATFAADQRLAGAAFLALAGTLDILDGAVARVSGQASPFGAFLDSVLDRYSDLLVLAGIVLLSARLGRLGDVGAALLAVVGTMMVSYTRARAESVGVECRIGFMERGERMLVLIVGALADLLVPAVWVVALGANVTAVHRIVHTHRATRAARR